MAKLSKAMAKQVKAKRSKGNARECIAMEWQSQAQRSKGGAKISKGMAMI